MKRRDRKHISRSFWWERTSLTFWPSAHTFVVYACTARRKLSSTRCPNQSSLLPASRVRFTSHCSNTYGTIVRTKVVHVQGQRHLTSLDVCGMVTITRPLASLAWMTTLTYLSMTDTAASDVDMMLSALCDPTSAHPRLIVLSLRRSACSRMKLL